MYGHTVNTGTPGDSAPNALIVFRNTLSTLRSPLGFQYIGESSPAVITTSSYLITRQEDNSASSALSALPVSRIDIGKLVVRRQNLLNKELPDVRDTLAHQVG